MATDLPVEPDRLDDGALRRVLLARASASTTALSVVDTRLPGPVLEGLLLAAPPSQPLGIALHLHEWLAAIDPRVDRASGNLLPAVLDDHLMRTEPLAVELELLDQAAEQKLALLFETVVDREFYPWLADRGIDRETYLSARVQAVRRLRDAWYARHTGRTGAPAPVGIAFNLWHAAIEMRGRFIARALPANSPPDAVACEFLPPLERLRAAAGDAIRRFYAGNSRPWELRLPEMLQRGRVLDPAGIVPELPLLRACLREDPTIADNITLEAPPQAALFSWMNQNRG